MNNQMIKTDARALLKENFCGLLFMPILVSLVVGAISGITCGLGAFFLVGVTTVGVANIYYSTVKNRVFMANSINFPLDNYWQCLKISLLQSIFIALWSLLFVIPGMVKTYSYALAPYIIIENPDYGSQDAITRSRYLMDGHKLELFAFDLSFIGWHLLGVITCGLGLLFSVPYHQTARARWVKAFFDENCKKKTTNTKEEKIEKKVENDDTEWSF